MKSRSFLSIAFLFPPLAMAQSAKTETKVAPLEISAEWSLPWEEISGIKLFQEELYIASDSSNDIGRFAWKLKENAQKRIDQTGAEKRTLVLADVAPKKKKKKAKKQKNSQWEAIAIDKAGTLFLVKETKDAVHVYASSGEWKQTINLASFAGRTRQDKGYEGLVLLKDSHFLIALTKPAILIEYGPKGSKASGLKSSTVLQDAAFELKADASYEALHSWKLTPESGCEFSDLSLGKDAKVYALLKDCNRIIQLPDLNPDGDMILAAESFALPAGIPHPEGLESLGDEGFLVASDVRAIERNLFWVRSVQRSPEQKSGYGK